MENYDLIVGVGWESAEYANNAQLEHPDAATYVVIDTDAGNENVTSITYNEEQAAYIMEGLTKVVLPGSEISPFVWKITDSSSVVNPVAIVLIAMTADS